MLSFFALFAMPQPAPAPRCGPVASRAQGRAVGEGSQVEPKQQLDIAQVPSPANALWGKKIKNPLFFHSRESTARRPTRGLLGLLGSLGAIMGLGASLGPVAGARSNQNFEVRASRSEVRGSLAFGGPPRRHGRTRAENWSIWTPGATRETKAAADARNKSIYLCVYIYIYIFRCHSFSFSFLSLSL